MENRRLDPKGRPRKVNRCLFGRPDPVALDKSLDRELKRIEDDDRKKWNFDFKAEQPLDHVDDAEVVFEPVRIDEIPDFYDTVVIESSGRRRPITRPSTSASRSHVRKASQYNDTMTQKSPKKCVVSPHTYNTPTKLHVTGQKSPKKSVIVSYTANTQTNTDDANRPVTRSTTRKRADESPTKFNPTEKSKDVAKPPPAPKNPTSRLRQAKLTNYLNVRKRSVGSPMKIMGPKGDEPVCRSPLHKFPRIGDEQIRAPSSPFRFVPDDSGSKSDVEHEASSETISPRKSTLRTSASMSRLLKQ